MLRNVSHHRILIEINDDIASECSMSGKYTNTRPNKGSVDLKHGTTVEIPHINLIKMDYETNIAS